jgi:hypothetical protein
MSQTIDQIIANENATRAEFERTTYFGQYTIAQLREAFDAVHNPDGWKLPWRASVSIDMLGLTISAHTFYMASRCRYVRDNGNGTHELTGDAYAG